jgi:predicted O-methyltransferase YrrM
VDAGALLTRLWSDSPKFHSITAEGARAVAELGVNIPPGDCSWAVGPKVLEWIAGRLTQDDETLETGAGYTTVVFAALGGHHTCCTVEAREAEKVAAYLDAIGVAQENVSFVIGPSDQTLPGLQLERPLSLAYIDGCHGYPMPALDWHYIDRLLRVGGIVGLDNAELRPVREHCDFLEEDGAYRLVASLQDGYFIRFFEKLADEPREWICQSYGRAKRDPCDDRPTTRLRRSLTRWIKPHLY